MRDDNLMNDWPLWRVDAEWKLPLYYPLAPGESRVVNEVSYVRALTRDAAERTVTQFAQAGEGPREETLVGVNVSRVSPD